MEPITVGLLSIPFLLLLLFLRVHVGLSLFAAGFFGYWVLLGDVHIAIHTLATLPWAVTATFTLSVLPLFMLMGTIAGLCGFAGNAYDAGKSLLGNLRGGLAIATVGANAIFGAACGATIAAVAIFTKFSLPEMKKSGYKPEFATASIAAAGALAMLIPPSSLMIVYGLLTEVSIGKMFIAGILPGLLLGATLCTCIIIMTTMNPRIAPMLLEKISLKEKVRAINRLWSLGILVFIIIGGMYTGFFTPVEAGAVGAFSAIAIALLMKRLDLHTVGRTLRDSSSMNAMIFLIFTGAQLYSRFIGYSGLPTALGDWVETLQVPPMIIMAVFMLMYLALGCIMDSISMMTLTMPIIFPIAMKLGWDPLWFGVILVVIMECGLLTPPVGLSVFAAKAAAGDEVEIGTLFKACTPFFFTTLATVVILIAFPKISTWLPELMM